MAENLIQQNIERFKPLCGAHLLLTGGTGFIGTWLLEFLAYLNNRSISPCTVVIPTRNVKVFARKAPHLAERTDFAFIEGDVRTFNYPDVPCDFIIHAAAPADRIIANSEPLQVVETIISGTQHVLELAARKEVKRFLFVSSGAVYGTQPPDCIRIPETYQGAPDLNVTASTTSVAYGEAKRLAEIMCGIYRENFNVSTSIARPFTLIGPYQNLDAGFAVTDFIRDGLQGNPIRINGDGSAVRSYCYGADAANWLLCILLQGQSGTAYNVGSDEAISILNLAKKVVTHLKVWGIQADIEFAASSPTAGIKSVSNRYVPDVSRAQAELKLTRRFDLDQALSQTLTWLANPFRSTVLPATEF